MILAENSEPHVGHDALAIELRQQDFASFLLRGIHRPRLQEFTIRQLRESFVPSLDPDELLDVAPPRRHVFVANRPVDRDAFACVRLVIEIAPAENAATPHDRLSANLPASYPREGFALRRRIRIVEIVDEELARVLVARSALTLNRLIALELIPIAHATVSLVVRHVVFAVVDRGID